MKRSTLRLAMALVLAFTTPALAQNGLSDDRVTLPDGPGSIGGVGENVDVNANMGSASFRVPIRVPAGASAAMTPSLALAYASGRGMGNAGIGWQIASPSIERTVNKGLPTYTSADHFAADGGTELTYVGDVGMDRIYRARFEGAFVRYTWRAVGAGAAGYWTAEYPDGRVGYFGATADGALVPSSRVQEPTGETFRYHLVELVDSVGRRMVQTFTKDAGWVLPDEIHYGFGGMATPRFSVRFGYEDRPDVMSSAAPGYEIQLAKRVNEIRVLSETATIRRYTLGYEEQAVSGGLSRLARVTEYGRDGGRHEVEHTFGYSRTLGGACAVGCEQPFMVDMGTLPGGVNIQTGLANLIDINGDSLPDVLESSASGEHRFHISSLSVEGRPSFTGDVVTSAATAGGSSFIPSNPRVQLLDVNGDGFTDIVDQVNGLAMCNTAAGDWTTTDCTLDPSALPSLTDDADADREPEGMRFFDYDNDKLIDLLRTPAVGTTLVSRNTGAGYENVVVSPLPVAFDVDNVQLSDVNGDGLQDVVQLIGAGGSSTLRYWLHLGFGEWAAPANVPFSDLSDALLDSAVLEDIDGNGLSDVVVVAGAEVAFWLNRGGGVFSARASLASADVDGDIPERLGAETVLFADMNGNGTDDVVWVSSAGHVRFLELFPVRPNLLSRVENGIGWVRVLEYGTSIAERARDEATSPWAYPLPNSMNVVKASDSWVTATGGADGEGVHERREFAYHDGHYDGEEKAFRGFERVERRLVASMGADSQQPGLEELLYDVGKNGPARHGLLLRQLNYGGPGADVPLNETRTEFSDCPVAEVPATADVSFVCPTATTVIQMEGRPEAEWAIVRTEKDYDGYGNVVEQRDLGVVGRGTAEAPMACEACSAPAGLASGACGADCLGDEQTTRLTHVTPGADTGGAWHLRLPVTLTLVGDTADRVTASYYDGPDFTGLAAGRATAGLLTRQTVTVSSGEVIPTARNAYDAQGNLAAILGPNGDPADTERARRDFTYDARGLRVTRVTVQAGAYDLLKDVAYESSFLKASEASDFYAVRGGTEITGRNASRFRYDEHGRAVTIIRPGFSDAMPTETFAYELADPVSRVVARARLAPGGEMATESIRCQDGRGRPLQALSRVATGRYRVDGFTVLNSRGNTVRLYQPYTATSGECAMSPPSGVAFTETRYDALDRAIGTVSPDASLHGSNTETRTEFGPLWSRLYDGNDADPESPFADTPLVTHMDGLARVVRLERLLTLTEAATHRLFYDSHRNLVRVEDPMGNAREQVFDLAGRMVRTVDPNAGETLYVRDAAGAVVERTDARGRTVVSAYDALDRLVERYDMADMMGTLERTVYDFVEGCTDCRNGAGRVVRNEYPLPTVAEPGVDEVGYDTRGRRVLLRRTLEGHAFETTYEWDAAGALTRAVYPDGQALEYGRDEAQRPLSIAGVVTGATYNDQGRLSGLEHANGVTAAMSYDALVRPSALSFRDAGGAAFVDLALTRDRQGNVLAVTDTGTGAVNHSASYGYDSWYRLTEAALESGSASEETVSFAYDLLDNLTSRTSSLGAASAAHVGAIAYGGGGAGPSAATDVGGVAYGYDAAGNLQDRGGLVLTHDHAGRLSQATPTGRRTTEMAYAPGGERVMKLEDGGVSYYAAPDFVVRDGIASVYPRFGNLRVARLRSDIGGSLLPDADGDGSITIGDAWAERAGDEPSRLRLLRASARRLLHEATDAETHLHGDLRGSIVGASDSTGALVAERSFHAFGLERQSSGFVDEHGFTGQELDGSTGLYRFRFRYLDPRAGRWAEVDPAFGLLDPDGVGRLGESTAGYAYVANNPVNSVDPDGLLGKKLVRRIGKGLRRAARSVRRAVRRSAVGRGVNTGLARVGRAIFPFRRSEPGAKTLERRQDRALQKLAPAIERVEQATRLVRAGERAVTEEARNGGQESFESRFLAQARTKLTEATNDLNLDASIARALRKPEDARSGALAIGAGLIGLAVVGAISAGAIAATGDGESEDSLGGVF